MLKVFDKVLKTKVEQLANKNQFVITYIRPNGSRVYSFQSYDSLIAVYDTEDGKLYINWCKWDFSKTTMKHLKMFIEDWTIYHYVDKKTFNHFIATSPDVETFTE